MTKGQKLADGKGVGGAQRLTEGMIKRIQNYYGLSIRQNKGNLNEMKKAILAIQHHIIEDPDKSLSFQHRFCPRGVDSWCCFWKDEATGCSMYQNLHRLPNVFMTELQPLFTRLSHSELLGRCLLGVTQNQKESLNGRLWSLVPKTRFCGKRRVISGVCEAICVSNTGAATSSLLVERLGIEPGENTLRALRQEDRARLYNATQKISEQYQKRIKRLKFQKTLKRDNNTTYKAGGFGVNTLPEEVVKTIEKNGAKIRKRKLNNSSEEVAAKWSKEPQSTNVVEIMFIDEADIDIVVTGNK